MERVYRAFVRGIGRSSRTFGRDNKLDQRQIGNSRWEFKKIRVWVDDLDKDCMRRDRNREERRKKRQREEKKEKENKNSWSRRRSHWDQKFRYKRS